MPENYFECTGSRGDDTEHKKNGTEFSLYFTSDRATDIFGGIL